jgi:hypothetical protein
MTLLIGGADGIVSSGLLRSLEHPANPRASDCGTRSASQDPTRVGGTSAKVVRGLDTASRHGRPGLA